MATKLSRNNGNLLEPRSRWEARKRDCSQPHALAIFAQLFLEGVVAPGFKPQKDLVSQRGHCQYDSIIGIPPVGLRLCLIYAYSG